MEGCQTHIKTEYKKKKDYCIKTNIISAMNTKRPVNKSFTGLFVRNKKYLSELLLDNKCISTRFQIHLIKFINLLDPGVYHFSVLADFFS